MAFEAAGAAQRTFVASHGVDSNSCLLVSPCRSFGAAMAQTAPGGEIVVLDSAGYGAVTITQAVSITAPPGIYAGVSVFGGTGITVNAGTGNKVTLRGLTINGLGGTTGIAFQTGDALYLDQVAVSGFGGGGVGLSAATGTATASLFIRKSAFRDNATGLKTGTTSGTLTLNIERTIFERNAIGADVQGNTVGTIRASTFSAGGTGLSAGSAGSGQTVKLDVRDCTISDNSATGIAAVAPSSPSALTVISTLVSGNATGILATGSGNSAFASDSTIMRNGLGLSAFSSGLIVSGGDNRLLYNTVDGTFTSTGNFPPIVNAGSDINVTLPAMANLNGTASDDGLPNPPGVLTTTWSFVSGPGIAAFGNAAQLSTTASFSAPGTYILRLTASDSLLSSSADVTVTVQDAVIVLPPDPSTVAPPIDPSVTTTVGKDTTFLYTGPNPIQTGVVPGTIDPIRAAVIRGKVITRAGAAMTGVTIAILNHPEFGQTLSRADGMFDIVVNGGGLLNVKYDKTGYLPVQRQISVPWQNFAFAPDVALITLDSVVSAIDLASATPIQVARGSPVSDTRGSRQATLLFAAGTTAAMVMPGGGSAPLAQMTVRATEYTIGTTGPDAMPGVLPAASAYTYAVELSVDEAIAAGATSVSFSKPVIGYLENFPGFEVGTIVPSGYFDRVKGIWIAAPNGRVIKILSVTAGIADVDIDGTGLPANGPALATLGVTTAERQTLASLYAIGSTVWRVPLTHFTPLDWNFSYIPVDGSTNPNQPNPTITGAPIVSPTECRGCIIEEENQILGERVALVGTPYTLNYRSGRTPGRASSRTVNITLSGPTVPLPLQSIRLEIDVAGEFYTHTYSPYPNQSTTFTWDGKDAYGRVVQGQHTVTVRIGYAYPLKYVPYLVDFYAAFGIYGDGLTAASFGGRNIVLWQTWQSTLDTWDARAEGLGGWTLDVQHAYDPIGKVVHLGDGSERAATQLPNIIAPYAGKAGSYGNTGDGGQALQATLYGPNGLATGADGSLYILSGAEGMGGGIVRRVDKNGIISSYAGSAVGGYHGDGGPATAAGLDYPTGALAVGPDNSLYIGEPHRIRRVRPDGIIETFAGTGVIGHLGDGGLATAAQIYYTYSLAAAQDGSVYVGDGSAIRRIGPDGTINLYAGSYTTTGGTGDGGYANKALFTYPIYLAVGPDGSVYAGELQSCRVRRITPDGIIRTAAGPTNVGGSGCSGGFSTGDGGPATQALMGNVQALAMGADGTYYIYDYGNARVRVVTPDGIINTFAGNGFPGAFLGDGGPATQASFALSPGIAVGAEGSVYMANYTDNRVRRIRSAYPGISASHHMIPSEDGSEIYEFDAAGKHLRTLDSLTGAVRLQFAYDSAGLLTSVTDVAGNVTTIQRSGATPTAIIGPFGQTTALTVDANGFLASITDPVNQAYALSSTAGGLLTGLIDPRGGIHSFNYDAGGRLIHDQDPAAGSTTLARTDAGATYNVLRTTALGRSTNYAVANLGNGDEKRTNTLPSGLQSVAVRGANGVNTSNTPDGMKVSTTPGPDPRFAMQAPIDKASTVTTPGGKVLSTSVARTATLTDPTNPLSLTALTETTTVNGHAFTSAYSAATKTFTNSTPLGRQSTTTLDALGRVIQTQVAGLNAVNRTYDSNGRLATITTGPRTLTFAYNNLSYLQSITDPIGRVESYLYDAAGRVTTQTLTDGRVIQYAYDATGNMTSLSPPGRPAHTFTFTPVDLMASYVPPNVGAGTNATTYAYNADRQLTQVNRPDGLTVGLGYDTAGRLSATTIARGTLSYTYSATTGNLASIAAPGGIGLTYAYDGSLPTGTTWSGPVAGSVTRTYDNDFRVTAVAVNGASIPLTYDNDSLLASAGSMTLARNAQNGLLTGTTLGNATDTWTYNGFGEPVEYSASYNAALIFDQQFTRDNLGRITQKIETIGGVTDTYVYSYDLAGRLTGVTKNGTSTASYTYDTNGNRASVTNSGGTVNGSYDAQDRMTQYGTATYAYSANGELQTKTNGAQVTTYQYDELGNLLSVGLPGGPAIAYVVDGTNRRIGKSVNGTPVQGLLYQDGLKPVAELNGSNTLVSQFVYGTKVNMPEYMIKGGVTYRIFTDHLGSPRLVVDVATGTVAQRIDYDEFGQVTNDTNPGFQPFGFAGGVYDKDTGLVRFGARDYDASTAIWTLKDPILPRVRSPNSYTYAAHDPVNITDREGACDDPGVWSDDPRVWSALALAAANFARVLIVPAVLEASPWISYAGLAAAGLDVFLPAFTVGFALGTAIVAVRPGVGTGIGDWAANLVFGGNGAPADEGPSLNDMFRDLTGGRFSRGVSRTFD